MPHQNPYQQKEAIGFTIMILGFIFMFVTSMINIYVSISFLIYASVALVFVGLLMVIINWVAQKIHKHQH